MKVVEKKEVFIGNNILEAYEVVEFNDLKKEKIDVLIEEPHGADVEKFVKINGNLIDYYAKDANVSKEYAQKVFLNYLNLEKDIGARPLAEKVAQFVAKFNPNLKVVLLRASEIPRGICDLNRFLEFKGEKSFSQVLAEIKKGKYQENEFLKLMDLFAIRPAIPYAKFVDIFKAMCESFYSYVEKNDFLVDKLDKNGIYVSVHTMRDYTVINPFPITPHINDLKEHIDGFDPFDEDGKLKVEAIKRGIELIGSFKEEHPEWGIVSDLNVSDENLVSLIVKEFEENSIPYSKDEVYWLVPWVRGSKVFSEPLVKNNGFIIDANVSALSEVDASQTNTNFDVEVSMKKVEFIADILARSIVKRHQEKAG